MNAHAPGASWHKLGELPAQVSATAAACLRGGDGLIAVASGVAGPFEGASARTCAMFKCGAATQRVYSGQGSITALAVHEDSCFAVRSVLHGTGAEIAGLLSLDAGLTWVELGRLPTASVTRVAVSSKGLLIATGGNRGMAVSQDFGKNWSPYRLPSSFSSATDFPVVLDDGVAIAGRGLQLLALSGRAEVRTVLLAEDVAVTFLRDGCIAALLDGHTRLGTFGGDGLAWGPRLAGDRLVLAAARPSQTAWRVLMRARDPSAGSEFAVAQTGDNGESWNLEERRLGPISDIRGEYGIAVESFSRQIFAPPRATGAG